MLTRMEQYRRDLRDLSDRAQADVKKVLDRADPSDPIAVRDLMLDLMPEIITGYGELAAATAADYYTDEREAAEVDEPFFVDMAEPAPPEQIEASTRYSAGALFRPNFVRDKLFGEALGVVDRLVKQPARLTIAGTAALDKAKPRFARVPSGAKNCRFCTMLASRGAVYATAESAGELHKFHAHCDCLVTPIFPGQGLPDGYDPDVYKAQYLGHDVSDATVKAAPTEAMTDEAAARIADLTRSQGGATVRLDGTAPDEGYVVAVHGHERIVENDEHLADEIKKYAADNAETLAQAGRHLGTWINDEDGKVYLDVSEVFDDRLKAVRAGHDRGEKAIFDLGSLEEIRMGPFDGFGRITPDDMDIEALKVNPHYGDNQEWGENCQSTSAATEFRMRGYDVVAKPNTGQSALNRDFESMKNLWTNKYGDTRPWQLPHSIDELKAATDSWPDGARGLVGVVWKDTKGAHVFNVIKRNGQPVFVDAQPARVDGPKPPGPWVDRVDWTASGGARILRIDDLTPSPAWALNFDPAPEEAAA